MGSGGGDDCAAGCLPANGPVAGTCPADAVNMRKGLEVSATLRRDRGKKVQKNWQESSEELGGYVFRNSNRVTLAGAAIVCIAALVSAGSASASTSRPAGAQGHHAIEPDGVPGHYTLTQSFTPAQLYAWRFPTNSPGGWTCTTSQVQLSREVIALHTTGADGNCAVIQSTQLFPTTSGVIEARIHLSAIPGQPTQIADWASMWMYGPNWPTDGEIDAVESSYGSSAVTYHYGSSDPADPTYNSQYTTYRPLYGNAQPLTVTGPNVQPGWNTVDIAFSANEIRIYYNGTLYTTAEGSYITGKPAYLVFDDVSASGENTLGIPGTVLVKDVRVFSPS